MKRPRSPLALLTAIFAGWVNRHQRGVIDYLLEENRILRAKLGRSRLLFTEPERRRRTSWKRFLKAHAASIVATDFFTTEVWTARGLITHYAPVANEWATNTERTGPAKDMSSHIYMAGARLVGPKRTFMCRIVPGFLDVPFGTPRCRLKPKSPPCTSKSRRRRSRRDDGRYSGSAGDASISHDESSGTWTLSAAGTNLTLTLDAGRDFNDHSHRHARRARRWVRSAISDSIIKVGTSTMALGARTSGFVLQGVSVETEGERLQLNATFELASASLRVTRHYRIAAGAPAFEAWNTYTAVRGTPTVSDSNALQIVVHIRNRARAHRTQG